MRIHKGCALQIGLQIGLGLQMALKPYLQPCGMQTAEANRFKGLGGLKVANRVANRYLRYATSGYWLYGVGYTVPPYPPKCNPVKPFICNCLVKPTTKDARNADYINPQELRVMPNTTLAETPTPVRCWRIAKRIILITFPHGAEPHGMFRMRSTSGETQKTIGLSQ